MNFCKFVHFLNVHVLSLCVKCRLESSRDSICYVARFVLLVKRHVKTPVHDRDSCVLIHEQFAYSHVACEL